MAPDEAAPSRRRPWLFWLRRLHGWLTIASFLALLLFAISGFAMHHGLGMDLRTQSVDAAVPPTLLTPIDQLGIVEWLRAEHGARGAVASFDQDEYEIVTVLERPGSRTAAMIDLASGTAVIDHERGGLLAIMGDIHNGKTGGLIATVMIDAVALVLAFAAISGLILWLKQTNRRREAWIALGIGSAVYAIVVSMLFL